MSRPEKPAPVEGYRWESCEWCVTGWVQRTGADGEREGDWCAECGGKAWLLHRTYDQPAK